jgi:hypothetical protein
MTGLLNNILWADAELNSISIGYDSATIHITETTGINKKICCAGYIGYQAFGIWDEVIIDSANLSENDNFIDKCLAKIHRNYGKPFLESGSPDRNIGIFKLLSIKFIDNTSFLIVASKFDVESF